MPLFKIGDPPQSTLSRLFLKMTILGYPFAPTKRQGPSGTGDFIGLVHDLSEAHTSAQITVCVRDRLQVKMQDIIATALADQRLHPGTAAKLYGCVTFLDQAAFGRVARAGLSALKDRQCIDTSSKLTPALLRAPLTSVPSSGFSPNALSRP